MQLHQQIGAEAITRVGNISSSGMMLRNRFFRLFLLLIWSLQYHIRMCGNKSVDTDKICKKCWIIFKLYQHPHLPGKSSAFTGTCEQKHRCRHSVFTYYTICFHRADNIIILHCAFKSSCQQGNNHLSFKILNQIFNLVVCKPSVPVCWITYVNTSQIQTRFGDWKSINFMIASKKKKRKVFRANV